MEDSIKSTKAEKLKEIEITINGVDDLETAVMLLSGKSELPKNFDLSSIKSEKTHDGFKVYPRVCCWVAGGRWVWGVDWFGYCEYRGEGCWA